SGDPRIDFLPQHVRVEPLLGEGSSCRAVPARRLLTRQPEHQQVPLRGGPEPPFLRFPKQLRDLVHAASVPPRRSVLAWGRQATDPSPEESVMLALYLL